MSLLERAPALMSLATAAERLHKSERWLKTFLRRERIGRRAGRTWLFTETDFRMVESAIFRAKERADLADKANDNVLCARVYVVGFGPYVKIGMSQAGKGSRIRSLQTGAPEKLEIYAHLSGGRELEAALHLKFKAYRLQGEWFRKRDTLAKWVSEGCPVVRIKTASGVKYETRAPRA